MTNIATALLSINPVDKYDFLVYSATATTFTPTFVGTTTTISGGGSSSTRASNVAHSLSIPAGETKVRISKLDKALVTSCNVVGQSKLIELVLEDYPKLTTVSAYNSNSIASVTLKNCPKLVTFTGMTSSGYSFYATNAISSFTIEACPLTSISLTGSMSNLEFLQPVKTTLSTFSIANNANLISADLSGFSALGAVKFNWDFSNHGSTCLYYCANLYSIDVSDSTISTLTVYRCDKLYSINAENCSAFTTLNGWGYWIRDVFNTVALTSLNLSGCTSLSSIAVTGNFANLDDFQDVSTSLVSLFVVNNNSLLTANLASFTKLTTATFSREVVANSSGSLQRCSNLQAIDVSGTPITALRVYGCDLLESIDCTACDKLINIYGYYYYTSSIWGGLPALNTLDLTGAALLDNVTLYNTPDIDLTLDVCDYLTLWLANGNKSAANVDEILAKCLAIAPSIASHPTLTLTGNSAPTAAGLADKATLIDTYGWAVATA